MSNNVGICMGSVIQIDQMNGGVIGDHNQISQPYLTNTQSKQTTTVLGRALKEGEEGKVPLDRQPQNERLIHNTMLPASFLLQGARALHNVCLIQKEGQPEATGFLVSSTILMTNHHVFGDDHAGSVRRSTAVFGFHQHCDGSSKPVALRSILLSDPSLDFALISLAESMLCTTTLPDWKLQYSEGQHANIIGHPLGGPKMISIRSNTITEVYQNAIEYTSDTEPGSSGSPVFNNAWQVIGLHSGGGSKNSDGKWISNKGFRMDVIMAKIKEMDTNGDLYPQLVTRERSV